MSRIQELKRNLSLALQESSWDDALSVLAKLVDMEGSQPAYHNQIGDIYLKSGRQSEALISFMRGVYAYRELEMFPNGAALCKKVLRLEPEQREAIWVLGELKTRQGFLSDGAEKMLEGLRAFAEDPDCQKEDLLEKLGQTEMLQAGNREALEFVATSYARINEAEMARCTTLRIAELEEREGNGEKARALRKHAQELCAEAGDAAPIPDPPAEEEPAVSDTTPFDSESELDETIESLTVTSPSASPTEAPEAPEEAEAEVVTEPECEAAVEIEAPDHREPPVESIELALEEAKNESVELLEITTPEAGGDSMDQVEVVAPEVREDEVAPVLESECSDEEVAESVQDTEECIEESVEPVDDAEDEMETLDFNLPASSDPELQVMSGPDAPIAGEEQAEEPEANEDAAALAESMLELMGGEEGDFPEVEILGDGSEDQENPEDPEDLLTTRQVVDSLRCDLADGSGIELIHEDDETEHLAIGDPEGDVDQESAQADRSSDDPALDPDEEWPVLNSWPGTPEESKDSVESDAEIEAAELDVHSLDESLREAEGDWTGAPAADEASDTVPQGVDFDADSEEQPISFGLTTTAGEALQTDDIEEVLGEFKSRMKEQVGSMAPEERYQLGVSYMEMGLHAEALDEFEHTLEHKVLGAKTREWMARCLLELNKPREIVLLLQTNLDAEPYPQKSMVELYYVLGQAYEMLNAADLALDAFTKVYQLDPEFRGIQEKLALLTDA